MYVYLPSDGSALWTAKFSWQNVPYTPSYESSGDCSSSLRSIRISIKFSFPAKMNSFCCCFVNEDRCRGVVVRPSLALAWRMTRERRWSIGWSNAGKHRWIAPKSVARVTRATAKRYRRRLEAACPLFSFWWVSVKPMKRKNESMVRVGGRDFIIVEFFLSAVQYFSVLRVLQSSYCNTCDGRLPQVLARKLRVTVLPVFSTSSRWSSSSNKMSFHERNNACSDVRDGDGWDSYVRSTRRCLCFVKRDDVIAVCLASGRGEGTHAMVIEPMTIIGWRDWEIFSS